MLRAVVIAMASVAVCAFTVDDSSYMYDMDDLLFKKDEPPADPPADPPAPYYFAVCCAPCDPERRAKPHYPEGSLCDEDTYNLCGTSTFHDKVKKGCGPCDGRREELKGLQCVKDTTTICASCYLDDPKCDENNCNKCLADSSRCPADDSLKYCMQNCRMLFSGKLHDKENVQCVSKGIVQSDCELKEETSSFLEATDAELRVLKNLGMDDSVSSGFLGMGTLKGEWLNALRGGLPPGGRRTCPYDLLKDVEAESSAVLKATGTKGRRYVIDDKSVKCYGKLSKAEYDQIMQKRDQFSTVVSLYK